MRTSFKLMTWVAAALLMPTLAATQAPAARGTSPAAHQAADSRPMIVKIQADWCAKCRSINKTWAQIEEELSDEARIVVLDVTDEKRTAASKRLAAELGISEFFAAFRAKTGTVAFFEPGAKTPSRVLIAEKDFAAYRKALGEVTT